MSEQRLYSKTLRLAVWEDNGGKNKTIMSCYNGCGRIIAINDFHFSVDRLYPVCVSCFQSMRTIKKLEDAAIDIDDFNEPSDSAEDANWFNSICLLQ